MLIIITSQLLLLTKCRAELFELQISSASSPSNQNILWETSWSGYNFLYLPKQQRRFTLDQEIGHKKKSSAKRTEDSFGKNCTQSHQLHFGGKKKQNLWSFHIKAIGSQKLPKHSMILWNAMLFLGICYKLTTQIIVSPSINVMVSKTLEYLYELSFIHWQRTNFQ